MGTGGRLGGAVPTRGVVKSPREMAVEVRFFNCPSLRESTVADSCGVVQAAERRRADDKACSHDSPSAVREAEKAAQQSTGHDAVDLTLDEEEAPTPRRATVSGRGEVEGQVIDLVSDDEDVGGEATGLAGRGRVFPPALVETEASAAATDFKRSASPGVMGEMQRSVSSDVKIPTSDRIQSPRRTAQTQKPAPPSASTSTSHQPYLHADGTWTCPTCTLNNPADARRCQACEGLKPIDESVGWRCEFCWEYGSEHGYWMCRNCGAIKKRG